MSEIGFFPHAPVQVPTTGWAAGVWARDVDISAIAGVTIPAGMTTVCIRIENTSYVAYSAGVQSSDDSDDLVRSLTSRTRPHVFIKLNSSKTLDFNTQNLTGLKFYVVGFANSIEWVTALDVSGQVTATSKNTTITASNITDSNAAFALVETCLNNSANTRIYPVGGYSTAQRGIRQDINHEIIPINGSKQFEANLGQLFGTNNFRVLGWLRSQHYSYVSAPVARQPATTTNYEDFPDNVPAGTKWACYIPAGGDAANFAGFRPKGSAVDTANVNPDHVIWCEPDANGVVEYKISAATAVHKYALAGYMVNQSDVTVTGTDDSTPNYLGSLTISGTGFGASQGSGSVTIGGVSQTVTSWADTSITVTVDRGTNKYGVALDLVVTNNDSVASTAYSVTLSPQAGWDYVNVGTPNPTASNRITATPDAATGDQLTWDTQSGDIIVYDDLTFSVASGVISFDCELWTTGDGWGATATQTISETTEIDEEIYLTTLRQTETNAKSSVISSVFSKLIN